MHTLSFSTRLFVQADRENVFTYLTDWKHFSDWLLFTHVKQLSKSSQLGAELQASTGIGLMQSIDTMAVSSWKPTIEFELTHQKRRWLRIGQFLLREKNYGCELVWTETSYFKYKITMMLFKIFIPIVKIFFIISLHRLKKRLNSLVNSLN